MLMTSIGVYFLLEKSFFLKFCLSSLAEIGLEYLAEVKGDFKLILCLFFSELFVVFLDLVDRFMDDGTFLMSL